MSICHNNYTTSYNCCKYNSVTKKTSYTRIVYINIPPPHTHTHFKTHYLGIYPVTHTHTRSLLTHHYYITLYKEYLYITLYKESFQRQSILTVTATKTKIKWFVLIQPHLATRPPPITHLHHKPRERKKEQTDNERVLEL